MKENDPSTSENRQTVAANKKKTKSLGHLAAELNPFYDEQKAPEHIGHVLIAAESTTIVGSREQSRAAEARKSMLGYIEKNQDQVPVPGTGKRIETMGRTELLRMSDAIMIDGTSLRQIYETHLIGERGLRRLIAEHVRGGDLKKALRQEVVEREIDFERDPALRGVISQPQSSRSGGASNAALNKLLEKVTMQGAEEGEEKAFYKARAQYETQLLSQHKKQRQVADKIITITIVFLVSLIILLYVTRG